MTDYSTAECIGHDPEWWVVNRAELTPANHSALVICDTCPLKDACLDDALPHKDSRSGVIRGGVAFYDNGKTIPPRKPQPKPRERRCQTCHVKLPGGRAQNSRKFCSDKCALARPTWKPADCGTDAGYYRHKRSLREDACDACKAAHSAAEKRRKDARRAMREARREVAA